MICLTSSLRGRYEKVEPENYAPVIKLTHPLSPIDASNPEGEMMAKYTEANVEGVVALRFLYKSRSQLIFCVELASENKIAPLNMTRSSALFHVLELHTGLAFFSINWLHQGGGAKDGLRRLWRTGSRPSSSFPLIES